MKEVDSCHVSIGCKGANESHEDILGVLQIFLRKYAPLESVELRSFEELKKLQTRCADLPPETGSAVAYAVDFWQLRTAQLR